MLKLLWAFEWDLVPDLPPKCLCSMRRAPKLDIPGVYGAEQCLLRHDGANRHTGHQDWQEDLGGYLQRALRVEAV